ncbi:MAG TPA: cell division protein FtsL [Burkholderiales bacterium]|nr:cell division protein FtsL [Burkholderiales bacterium]
MTRFNFILLAVLMVCALALVTSQHRARKLYVQLQQELELEKKYELEWNQLQLTQGEWAIHARIEKIATQQLRMRAPSAARTQLVPHPGEASR